MRSRAAIFAYLVLAGFVALALIRVQESFDSNNSERDARKAVQAEINRYVCVENNHQDRLLGSLIGLSLQGVHKHALTPHELTVVNAYSRAEKRLEHGAPCNAIAAAFLEASDTEDLKEVRRILYSSR